MSLLEYHSRPLVAFDPSNREHREYYAQFIEYKGWGRCPVRFICPDQYGYDLTIQIRNMLIEYYVHKEFGEDLKNIQPKIRPKAKKLVDNKKV